MQHNNYLTDYLEQLPLSERTRLHNISSGYFCADEYNADLCANLILQGIKTATCSLKVAYERAGELLPQVGSLHIVTNWLGEPVCITKLVEVTECAFNQVSAEFASFEGEGDRSLENWRDTYKAFFEQECQLLGLIFTDSIVLILERFTVVYIDQVLEKTL